MSLIMFMETDEGLILAGDSRLSRKTDPNWHRDDAEKVFACINKVGIAYHGEADINGEPMGKIINDFILTVNQNDTIKNIMANFQAYIKAKGNPDSKFYILGYENLEKQIFQFNVHDNTEEDWSEAVHGTGGRNEIAWPVMSGKFDIHNTNKEAIQLIYELYQKTMEKIDSVGGPIDILFISNNGTTWIEHK